MTPTPKILSFECDLCEMPISRGNRGGLCINCYRKMRAPQKVCACGCPLKNDNVSGLCKPCKTIEWSVPFILRADFRAKVEAGELPETVAASLRLADVEVSFRRSDIPRVGEMVVEAVAKILLIRVDDITGHRRNRRLVHARACIAMVMIENGYSYPRIGRLLGGRDHSTIINLVRNFDIYSGRNSRLPGVVESVRVWIRSKRAEWSDVVVQIAGQDRAA